MDSEIHHDPFAPEGANAMTDFDAARWSRAGATDEELAVLTVEHDVLPEVERAGMNGWITSVSDGDLRAILEARREAEPDGFVAAIPEQPLHPTDQASPLAATAEQAAFVPDEDEDKPKSRSHSR